MMAAFGACTCCGFAFVYNPELVPTTRDHEPICRGCMLSINTRRQRLSL
jgi:hypothetical protein